MDDAVYPADYGLAAGPPWVCDLVPPGRIPELRDYRLEVVGLEETPPGRGPLWWFLPTDGTERGAFFIQVWVARCRYHDDPWYAELRWVPGQRRADVNLCGFGREPTPRDKQHVEQAAAFLRDLAVPERRGRPPGRMKLRITPDEFRDAYRALRAEHRRNRLDDPYQYQLADYLDVSEDAVARFRKDQRPRIPWPPI